MRKIGLGLAFAGALSVAAMTPSAPARADGGTTATVVAIIGAVAASQLLLCDPKPDAKNSVFCIWWGRPKAPTASMQVASFNEAGSRLVMLPFTPIVAGMGPNIIVKPKKKK